MKSFTISHANNTNTRQQIKYAAAAVCSELPRSELVNSGHEPQKRSEARARSSDKPHHELVDEVHKDGLQG